MLSIPDESEFIAKLRSGDERAFMELVERHHAGLLRMAQIFVSDRALAEEIVQETWLAVIHGIDAFEGRASIKTWIFAIMTNQAKRHASKARRTINLSALDRLDAEDLYDVDASRFAGNGHWLEPPLRWRINPEERLQRAQLLDVIKGCIESLPEKQRIVVTMRDVQGFTTQDVTSVLGISEGNQRLLLHRARAAIRLAIETHLRDT